ncbi:MAG: hypothetical protein JSR17_12440 [Proteobacteria bacterium]|nr:hypothetical protein [Pseudomonadota bacterium]
MSMSGPYQIVADIIVQNLINLKKLNTFPDIKKALNSFSEIIRGIPEHPEIYDLCDGCLWQIEKWLDSIYILEKENESFEDYVNLFGKNNHSHLKFDNLNSKNAELFSKLNNHFSSLLADFQEQKKTTEQKGLASYVFENPLILSPSVVEIVKKKSIPQTSKPRSKYKK